MSKTSEMAFHARPFSLLKVFSFQRSVCRGREVAPTRKSLLRNPNLKHTPRRRASVKEAVQYR